ncbi:hypothetical protein CCUS01_03405 [Colletotrichum cuscutae]|uniref:Uncharacterized protein n=1 Tax=Colletotrichum cuscutae TaxID=1209917 RepID=A0AAI9Y8F7_9PEZI|nr:hypothetical protein CCUS01_03405 [Colletotrichum cuscutae]
MEKQNFTLEGSQGQATPQALPIPGSLNGDSIPVDGSQHDENKGTLLGEANSAQSSTNTPGDTVTASTTISGDVPTSTTSHDAIGIPHTNSSLGGPVIDANDRSELPNQSQRACAGTPDAWLPERKQFHTITIGPTDEKGNQKIVEKWITEEELLKFNVGDKVGATAM